MISCVIRTFNECEFIGELLNTLTVQSIGDKLEIIVIDSGSTDGTIEIVERYKTKLIQIKKEEFNYSYALNLGIENSTNELIAILSGHSIPFDESCLEKMVSHFKDEKVAGVYCKQIARPNADPCERLRLEKTFGDESIIFNNKAGLHFSNAASCIRRSIWKRHPFVIMPAAEDKEWAQWTINHGYKIIYDAAAEVYHSHTEPCRKSAERIIQLERASDLRINRNRNGLLTLKQSIGLFVRDFKQIPILKENIYKKFMFAKDCAARSFWYAYDFNRKK